jgi:hypothetical protein
MLYKLGKIVLNFPVMKDTLLYSPKQFFHRNSPRILEGWLRHHTIHSLAMLYKLSKIGLNRSVMKGTSVLRQKQFFHPISPHTAAGWQRQHAMHSLAMR